ncbi:MAG TPA: hypothetical protein DEB39_02850 [Planctomycetaceae bacterium]|nr:hypothetical protein [Planctomycetaceae bacterium]
MVFPAFFRRFSGRRRGSTKQLLLTTNMNNTVLYRNWLSFPLNRLRYKTFPGQFGAIVTPSRE